MNIAIFSRVIFLSGVTTHIIDLSKQLIKKGHKVYIFTAGVENPNNSANIKLFEKLKNIGVTTVIIPFPFNPRNKIAYLFSLLKSIPIVRRQLKINKIDVIHIHTPALSIIPVVLRKKYVKTIHIKNLSLSVLNRKATHEITISRETYLEAKKKFKYKENEVSLIFNGVDEAFSEEISNNEKTNLKKQYNLPLNKIILGIVGTISFRKGHDILLKAISKLTEEEKNKIHLIIVGDGDIKQKKWLTNLIDTCQLNDMVSVFNFQQNPKPFYDMMDIFVLPSRLEGFGLVVIEAMLSECCVIRSNTEGAYDQIQNKINGFVFENENSDELSSIISKLINDEETRVSVAKKGKEVALQNFTSEIMADKTIEVYKKVMTNA